MGWGGAYLCRFIIPVIGFFCDTVRCPSLQVDHLLSSAGSKWLIKRSQSIGGVLVVSFYGKMLNLGTRFRSGNEE